MLFDIVRAHEKHLKANCSQVSDLFYLYLKIILLQSIHLYLSRITHLYILLMQNLERSMKIITQFRKVENNSMILNKMFWEIRWEKGLCFSLFFVCLYIEAWHQISISRWFDNSIEQQVLHAFSFSLKSCLLNWVNVRDDRWFISQVQCLWKKHIRD